MQPFISSYEYNFIKMQAQNLVNGHASANDQGVLEALRALSREKVLTLFTDLSTAQIALLQEITNVKSKEEMELFLAKIKPYVVPFPEITEQAIRKLFPKAKKLKAPSFEQIDLRDISYLGWDDKGSGRKYIIAPYQGKLVGIYGTFTSSHQKGICTLCNRHEVVGMFLSEKKGSTQDQFIKHGNYICQNSQACNQNITTLERLHDLIERLN